MWGISENWHWQHIKIFAVSNSKCDRKIQATATFSKNFKNKFLRSGKYRSIRYKIILSKEV